MSNFCEVCKRPYPDELAACPHCEEAMELADDDVIEVVEEAPEAGQEDAPVAVVEPDSAVDLGIPALPSGSKSGQVGEGSGLSVVEWASLVEEGPTPAEPAAAQFDAPSDADLLPAAAPPSVPNEPTLAQPPVKDDDEDALASDLDAVRSIFAGDASASFARHVPPQKPVSPPPSADDDSALNLLAPDEPVPPSAHEQAVEAAGSGIDLTAADLEQEVVAESLGEPPVLEVADSGIDLTEADLIVEGPAAAGPVAAAADSDIDLTEFVEEEAPAEAVAGLGAGAEESGIDLADLMADEPASGAAVVAEVVDSGIDLDQPDVVEVPEPAGELGGPAPADSDIEVADVLAPEEAPPEELAAVEIVDSGVGLGGPAVFDDPLSDESVIGQTGESGLDLGDAIIVGSSMDLTGAALVEGPPSDAPWEPAARPISDAGLDLSGEGLEASSDSGSLDGIEKNSPDTSESGRDLIAEEVESGVNLPLETFDVVSAPPEGPGTDEVHEIVVEGSGSALAAGQLASEAEEVDLTEMSSEIESSAVDLGASATFPVAPPEAPEIETTRPYEVKSKSIHGEEEIAPSEVNLGGVHDEREEEPEDFFEESEALGGGGPPIRMVDEEAVDPDVMEEPTEALDEKAEPEEPGPVAEEEEERPARRRKPEKRRSGAGGWLVGAVVGGLAATGVCLGLWLFSIEPPKDWRARVAGLTGATTPPANTNGAPNPGNGTAPAGAPATLADKMAMVQGGDLDRAKQANIETADETKSDELAARGEYRVREYLQHQSVNKAPIKPDDPALQAGLKDLETAAKDNADALFYLAVAREATNDLAGAQKTYAEGLERYKNDAVQRERFEAGLNRVTAEAAGKPAGMGRAMPKPDAVLLALLLTGLEPPAEPPPAKDAPPAPPAGGGVVPTEAGSAFWKAERLAQDQDYVNAIKALDQAITVHTIRRFSVLGKAQNPNSDPTEEIFIRSCKELEAYYQLQEKLRTAGYLNAAKGQDAPKAVDDLVTQNKDLTDKLAKAGTDAETVKKDLDTATKDLADSKKEAETTKKELDTTKKDLDAAKLDLADKMKDLAAAEKNATDLTAKLKTADATAAKKDEALKAVADVLRPRFVKPEADDAAILAGAKEAMRIASVGDPRDRIRGLERQVTKLNRTLTQRWAPEQMLTFWLPLLRERGRRDLADDAITDADRVLDDDAAAPAAKARALAVRGIALRDEEKYADAKADLEQAKKDLPIADGEWMLETEMALAEASDPSAYFASRAEAFRREGRAAQAFALLGRALETAGPGARTRLLVERGTWRLDDALVRGRGRAAADDPDLAAARKDAEDAAKDGTPEALYLSGRIAEELGQLDAAIDDYRQALGGHSALDADGARYRAALARVLVQPRPVKPAAPPVEGGGKVGKKDARPSLDVLAALLTVGLQPADLPGEVDADTKAALKLADEILAAKEGDVPFEARAQALAVKGRWTEALTTYVEGLRPSLSPEHAAELARLVQGNPNLRQPSVLTAADPLGAEKHYAAGLRWYYDHEYAKAEKEFFEAVEHDGQDARYYYFLGLARLMLGDRDAAEDFEQGARLERQNRPARAAVSAALERVQGAARSQLNDIRDRPR